MWTSDVLTIEKIHSYVISPVPPFLPKMVQQDWLYPEKITASRPRWNTRTTGATQAQIKRTRINSEFDRSNMYRYNYRAEVLPPKQPPHLNKSHRFRVDGTSEEEKKQTKLIMESDPIFNGQSKR